MKKYGMAYQEALSTVREKRPIVHPNSGFQKQLMLLEEQLAKTAEDE